MPRQALAAALLKKLDTSESLQVTVQEMRIALEEYECLMIQERPDASLDFKDAIEIYNLFHLLSRQPTWGQVPFGCICNVCLPHCVCRCTLLFTSLFNPEVCVPTYRIAAFV
jgi:hypothetical protein